MRKLLAFALGLALVGAMGWAEQQRNNPTTPLAVSDTSGTVTFTGAPIQSVHFTNDGANPAIIRVFVTCETVVAILATDTKARSIKPGEGWGLEFGSSEVLSSCSRPAAGSGYLGFAHVATTGLTTSVRWFAK